MSEIIPFFNGKSVFVTGATGFVAKLLVEHLLRKFELKSLYILIKPKLGGEPEERIKYLFKDIIL